MLLAIRCPVCGVPGAAPCGRCLAELRPAPELAVPPGLDRCVALLAYEGAGRELVARLKYRNDRAALAGLAAAMASLVDAAVVDVVTWAPTTPARRRARGFDHAALLARGVGRSLGVPARPLLRRRGGEPQTGRSAADRRDGPVFEPSRRPVPPSVLVVDDVATTGATLSAAARCLRGAGARTVTGLLAARTPPRAGSARSGHPA